MVLGRYFPKKDDLLSDLDSHQENPCLIMPWIILTIINLICSVILGIVFGIDDIDISDINDINDNGVIDIECLKSF